MRGDRRIYLDWNASAPLRPQARTAMLAAMDVVGNPSSVHADGRAARAIIEQARIQVAALVGCAPEEVVFTSGATEAAALAIPDGPDGEAVLWPLEHDCVWKKIRHGTMLDVSSDGLALPCLRGAAYAPDPQTRFFTLCGAQSETGAIQPLDVLQRLKTQGGDGARSMADIVQLVGKVPFHFADTGLDLALVSAHKIGGPKGVGALIARGRALGDDARAHHIRAGGGQEMGARSGTENVIGIAGFGAAAAAAARDLETGVWEQVAKRRDDMEEMLGGIAPELFICSQAMERLPNTACLVVPGWKGETQVMAMDLAGFSISAGSACSSGKVARASRVLQAMGYDEMTAASAVRISIGPTTTMAHITAFADAWADAYRRWKAQAA